MRPFLLAFPVSVLLSCAHAPSAQAPAATPAAPAVPGERHLADVRQLTFGGENAEAYWSFDGTQLSFQAHSAKEGCDRIYRMPVSGAQPPKPQPVSSGKG